MKKIAAVLMATALMPAVVMAETASGALTLGYESGKAAGARAHAFTFDGIVGVNLGNNLTLNARANLLRGKINGMPGRLEARLLGLGLGYALGNGGWVGASLENGGVGITGIVGTLDYTQLGIEGGFAAGGADVTGFYANSREVESIGFSAKFSQNARYQIGGGAIHSSIDTGAGKQGANYLGVAGVMNVANSLSVFGGVAHTTVNGTGAHLTSFGLGASYGLGESLGGSSVSLELGRTNVDDGTSRGHMNVVRVGLTIPLGRGSAAVPQNSVAGAVLNPTKNAISQTVLSAF